MRFKKIETRTFILENFKISDINLNYLKWLKNENISKFITKSNFDNLVELKKFIKRNYLKKNSFFLRILDKKKSHIGNVRIYNINFKKIFCTFWDFNWS